MGVNYSGYNLIMDILQLPRLSAANQDKRRRELYEKSKKDTSKLSSTAQSRVPNLPHPAVPLLSEEAMTAIQQEANEIEDEKVSSEPHAMKMLRYIASLKPYQQ